MNKQSSKMSYNAPLMKVAEFATELGYATSTPTPVPSFGATLNVGSGSL